MNYIERMKAGVPLKEQYSDKLSQEHIEMLLREIRSAWRCLEIECHEEANRCAMNDLDPYGDDREEWGERCIPFFRRWIKEIAWYEGQLRNPTDPRLLPPAPELTDEEADEIWERLCSDK